VAGDPVVATLKQAILVGDRVAFPAGSQVHGTFTDVKSASKGFKDTGGGAAIGAAIGTAVAGTTKGREAKIKADDVIEVALEQDARITMRR